MARKVAEEGRGEGKGGQRHRESDNKMRRKETREIFIKMWNKPRRIKQKEGTCSEAPHLPSSIAAHPIHLGVENESAKGERGKREKRVGLTQETCARAHSISNSQLKFHVHLCL